MEKEAFCRHCELKILDESLLESGFCCLGCESAYGVINEFGLKNYYQLRQTNPEIRNIRPEELEEIDLGNFVIRDENGDFEVLLAIDGLHCAACVWLIEAILRQQENVILARVNLTKKYLRLRFKGDVKEGLRLVNLVRGVGYKLFPFDEEVLAQEEKKYNNELVKSLAVAGFGAGNIMLFSIALWFYNDDLGQKTRDLLHFFSALIALPAIIYSSRVFFKSAFKSLKSGMGNMDVAISVAIFLTCTTSFIEIFKGAKHVYFDSAMMLCFFLLISRYLDFRARKKAFDVGREFSLLSANYARIIDENGAIKVISVKNVEKNMTLSVAPGEKIAADGVLLDDAAEIDNSLISGESSAKKLAKGDEVFSGAINLGKNIRVKVIKNPEKSLIAEIKNIVEEIEAHKNKYVNWADKLSRFYTPMVHLFAFATFCFWYFLGQIGPEGAILNAISVLIITCPCALALAIPVTQSLTLCVLMKKGVIVKSGDALEKISDIDAFVFDKTGTLTKGEMTLESVKGVGFELTEREKELCLKIASSLADKSLHPVAKAISASYGGTRFNLDVKEDKGLGLSANFENKIVKLGKRDFFTTNISSAMTEFSVSYMNFGDKIVAFYFNDVLKDDAQEFIAKLGKSPILLSGDDEKAVRKIAQELEIREFYFEKTPLEKVDIIKKLQEKGLKIAAFGDGFNDAGLLALADVSFSFLKGSSLTKNVADIVINGEKLLPIFDFIRLSRRSALLMKQNLFLALAYNLCALPFAFLGLVTPLFAALLMSSSSILVTLNSLRILKK